MDLLKITLETVDSRSDYNFDSSIRSNSTDNYAADTGFKNIISKAERSTS
jgi:hypothetical protein